MKEVEVKFLDINQAELIKHLTSLGATQAFDGEMHARYFNPQKENTTLRIRTEGNKHVLAYKDRNPNSKFDEKEETEIEINEPQKLEQIFEKLGFNKKAEIKKHRTSYKYKNWSFEFDTIPNYPTFLEIEGQSEEHVQEAITLLKLNPKDAKSFGWQQVIKYYEARH